MRAIKDLESVDESIVLTEALAAPQIASTNTPFDIHCLDNLELIESKGQ